MNLSIHSFEVDANGTVFVQLLKNPPLVSGAFHRFPLTPDCNIAKIIAAQEVSLQRDGYPALSGEDKSAIFSACAEAWTPEVIASYNAFVTAQKAAAAAMAADAEIPKSVELARAMRAAAYKAPDGPDAMFFKWQRGDATEADWKAAVAAVKAKYPDPPQPA